MQQIHMPLAHTPVAQPQYRLDMLPIHTIKVLFKNNNYHVNIHCGHFGKF